MRLLAFSIPRDKNRMMNRSIVIFFVAVLAMLAISSTIEAKPKRGFHTGPYLLLEGGGLQADYDTDVVTGEQIGRDFEPTFGFLFGWNIWDELSTELQGRYATNLKSDRRQHIACGNIYAKWTLITDALTDFKSFRILPFLKGGMSMQISVLPGNRNATHDTVTQIGFGPSPGAGIAFLWFKYFYFGIDIQGDLLFFDNINQTVSGVPNTLVYRGGFHPSFSAMGMIGVHY